MKLTNVEKAFVTGNVLLKVRQKLDRIISTPFRYFWAKKQNVQKDKIVFMTYGNTYDCNLKYIAEEILAQGLPYELIWLVTKVTANTLENFPQGITVVKKESYMGLYHMATARVWLDNALNLVWYPTLHKKKDQIFINTWHGSMGLKRIGKDDVQDRVWKHAAARCKKITDYCISDSDFEDKVFRETYWPDTKILKYGHARNDILFEKDPKKLLKLREKALTLLGLIPPMPIRTEYLSDEGRKRYVAQKESALNCKYILYAPTFRDSNTFDCYNIDFEKLVDALEKRFGGTWRVLVRFHFHNRNEGRRLQSRIFVNATDYPDIQELLTIADAGITDYSSWICDYALTGKPAFIYAADLDEYNNERGLYYPLETTPFPIAKSNDELIRNVESFDEAVFEERRVAFLEDKGCVEDGHATQRVVELIKKAVEG